MAKVEDRVAQSIERDRHNLKSEERGPHILIYDTWRLKEQRTMEHRSCREIIRRQR